MPFIFASFNGTSHDVKVITHEAGHAFAAYMNRFRSPADTCLPSLEGCEVHSMSMEFFSLGPGRRAFSVAMPESSAIPIWQTP